MRDLSSSIALERLFAFGDHDGNGAFSDSIDRLGFESFALFFEFGEHLGGSIEFDIHGSDNGSDWIELTGPTDPDSFPATAHVADYSATIPVFETDGGSPTTSDLTGTTLKLDVTSGHRFYKVEWSGPIVPGTQFGVYAVLGHPTERPVT